MTSTFYKYKHYDVYIRDRNVYEKLKCLCRVPSTGNLTDERFNQLVETLINNEYARLPSPLGV